MPSCRRPCQAAAQHGSIRRSTPTNYHCTVGAAIGRPYRSGDLQKACGNAPHQGLPLRGAVMAQGAMTERCCRTGARNQPGLFRQLLTPHQQSWMENSTRQGARTPGQGRQFKNSSIRRALRATSPQGEALGRSGDRPLQISTALTSSTSSTGAVYGLYTISCIYPYNRQQFLVVFPSFREIIPGK